MNPNPNGGWTHLGMPSAARGMMLPPRAGASVFPW